MENRYKGVLQSNNELILEFGSPYGVAWHIAALELKLRDLDNAHVLEFGCGEGHSASALLRRTNISMDLLDINPAMIASARSRLKAYRRRVRFIESDVMSYLADTTGEYEVIFSSFVVHNFLRVDRPALFRACLASLRPQGLFILDDSIPQEVGDDEAFSRMVRKYRYLPPQLQEAIVEHVTQDNSLEYRMPEEQVLSDLREAGFRDVEVVDRVEREALIFARKP